jgi:hypothetical protein
MENSMQKIAMLALMSLSTAALAGSHWAPEITIYTYKYHHKWYSFADGSLVGAAASADDNQWIGCSTYRYIADGSDFNYGFCSAVDADYNSTGCYTEDAAMIAIIASVTATSRVNFAAIDGACTSVYVDQSSGTL